MARVLVDSSVWIDFFRTGRSRESEALRELALRGQVCISDIIRVELLSGARTEPEYRMLEDHLAAIPLLEIPEDFWNQVAQARFLLGRSGFQASVPDVSIAMIARHHGSRLLTADRPLFAIAKRLSVRMYQLQ